MTDHYTTLGVSRRAKPAEIKEAYHRLALKLHPDKNLGTAASCAAFQQLIAAYETLSTPHTRALYNMTLHQETLDRAARQGFGIAHGWAHNGYRSASAKHEGTSKTAMDEIFAQREKQALENIQKACRHIAALAQKHREERKARGFLAGLRSEVSLLFRREEGEVRANRKREEWERNCKRWQERSAALMELERGKVALGAIRRMRGEVEREGWWREADEGREGGEYGKEEEGQRDEKSVGEGCEVVVV